MGVGLWLRKECDEADDSILHKKGEAALRRWGKIASTGLEVTYPGGYVFGSKGNTSDLPHLHI